MTTPTIQELYEQKAQQLYAAEIAATNALKAAGGLASDMTLRDHFAGHALIAIMPHKRTESYVHAAAESYKMADAMLKARKTPEGDG
jgi:hypothetical protein